MKRGVIDAVRFFARNACLLNSAARRRRRLPAFAAPAPSAGVSSYLMTLCFRRAITLTEITPAKGKSRHSRSVPDSRGQSYAKNRQVCIVCRRHRLDDVTSDSAFLTVSARRVAFLLRYPFHCYAERNTPHLSTSSALPALKNERCSPEPSERCLRNVTARQMQSFGNVSPAVPRS